jgi:16S rRNA C1402 (ribose-2'-O) methylase RsmI
VYIVSTPIGNANDITFRAVDTLQEADVIAAEDCRKTGILLADLGVKRRGRLVSHHHHNWRKRVPELVEYAKQGQSVAVVSDAGTPTVCDPGFQLVQACREANVAVHAVPGPSAFLAALSVSGLPCDEFCFLGFLPRRGAARQGKLQELADANRTSLFYESPYRLVDTLESLAAVLDGAPAPAPASAPAPAASSAEGLSRPPVAPSEPAASRLAASSSSPPPSDAAAAAHSSSAQRPCVVARELTKTHEEVFHGTLQGAIDHFGERGGPREGEVADAGDGAGGSREQDRVRGELVVMLGAACRSVPPGALHPVALLPLRRPVPPCPSDASSSYITRLPACMPPRLRAFVPPHPHAVTPAPLYRTAGCICPARAVCCRSGRPQTPLEKGAAMEVAVHEVLEAVASGTQSVSRAVRCVV